MRLYKFNNQACFGWDFEAAGLYGFVRFDRFRRSRFAARAGKMSPLSRTWRLRLAWGRFTFFATPDLECPTHMPA